MGLAFLDVGMYVTSIRVFKNLLLVGDFVKSLIFATLQVCRVMLASDSRNTRTSSRRSAGICKIAASSLATFSFSTDRPSS